MPGLICSKFFVSHSNSWHHPFEIFRQQFQQLASSVWNFLLAVQMDGLIHSKFFVRGLNSWHHPFENFPMPFKRLQHPFAIFPWLFERYLKPSQMAGTSVSHLLVTRSFWPLNRYLLVYVFMWEVTFLASAWLSFYFSISMFRFIIPPLFILAPHDSSVTVYRYAHRLLLSEAIEPKNFVKPSERIFHWLKIGQFFHSTHDFCVLPLWKSKVKCGGDKWQLKKCLRLQANVFPEKETFITFKAAT